MDTDRRGFLKTTAAAGLTVALSPLSALQGQQPAQQQSDDALLDDVQRQTLRYFTDFAHPDNCMIRERSNNMQEYGCDLVSSGATGFGVMALVVGQSRGWLQRNEAIGRITKILEFLESADRFNGVFPHFMHAENGKVYELFKKDDGGDLVETSFLMMGLLTARQYYNGSSEEETALRQRITRLYEEVDWKSHERENPDTKAKELMWHHSPNHGYGPNLPITGWNEALVTYVLAAASPTHPISQECYEEGWCKGNSFATNRTYFDDITLPLGPTAGGPLFFSHYSFMGLSPEGLKDKHADYWQQNTNHTLLNREHCIRNPKHFDGYGKSCWGLTASDTPGGYSAHCPNNDIGTISPTAALSAMPYTPEYSMEALRHFRHTLGDKIWGEYGFKDAFNESKNWVADTYIGIDQAPIIVMTENHRTGLPWQLFMSCPEVKAGLSKLEFESPYLSQQPPALTHLSRQGHDAQHFLDKLCGTNGIRPMDDQAFARTIGIDEQNQWQIRLLRNGRMALNPTQKQALLESCGYCGKNEINQASISLNKIANGLALER